MGRTSVKKREHSEFALKISKLIKKENGLIKKEKKNSYFLTVLCWDFNRNTMVLLGVFLLGSSLFKSIGADFVQQNSPPFFFFTTIGEILPFTNGDILSSTIVGSLEARFLPFLSPGFFPIFLAFAYRSVAFGLYARKLFTWSFLLFSSHWCHITGSI